MAWYNINEPTLTGNLHWLSEKLMLIDNIVDKDTI